MKLLLEKARAMDYEIVGIFDDHQSINKWMKENYDYSFEEYADECDYEPTFEDFYDEMEIRVRPIP